MTHSGHEEHTSCEEHMFSAYIEEKMGIDDLFMAFLTNIILAIPGLLLIMIASRIAVAPWESIALTLYVSGTILAMVTIACTFYLYKGFKHLARVAEHLYGIGAKGALLYAAGKLGWRAGVVVLARLLAGWEPNPESLEALVKSIIELVNEIHRIQIVVTVFMLVAAIGSVMVFIALWRLGRSYPTGGKIVRIGLILGIAGSAIHLIHLKAGTVIGVMSSSVVLYGLYRVKNSLGRTLAQSKYMYMDFKCRDALDKDAWDM